jgi:predicted transcriptional regulator
MEVRYLPEEWTGTIVGKMHVNGITYEELAKKLGITKSYVSMILSGSRHPAGAEQRFKKALNEIIQQRTKTE